MDWFTLIQPVQFWAGSYPFNGLNIELAKIGERNISSISTVAVSQRFSYGHMTTIELCTRLQGSWLLNDRDILQNSILSFVLKLMSYWGCVQIWAHPNLKL